MSVHAKDYNAHQNHIYYRIAVSAAFLVMHIINTYRACIALYEKLPQHPELQVFADLSLRYATVWNITIQNVYACLALACDLSILMRKPSMVPDSIRTYRNTLFYGLLFPMGMAVCTVFWPYYIYDRELIFPKKADLIMTFFENFICHGMVSLYALFELAFIPRDSRKDVYNPLKYLNYFNCFYVFTMFFTRFVDMGIWPYDVLTVTEGSMAFHFVLVHPIVSSLIFYYTQWKIQDVIWSYIDYLIKKRL